MRCSIGIASESSRVHYHWTVKTAIGVDLGLQLSAGTGMWSRICLEDPSGMLSGKICLAA